MTEIQEVMLHICFGAITGVFLGEVIVLIASGISWIKDKIRNRKERKKSKDE